MWTHVLQNNNVFDVDRLSPSAQMLYLSIAGFGQEIVEDEFPGLGLKINRPVSLDHTTKRVGRHLCDVFDDYLAWLSGNVQRSDYDSMARVGMVVVIRDIRDKLLRLNGFRDDERLSMHRAREGQCRITNRILMEPWPSPTISCDQMRATRKLIRAAATQDERALHECGEDRIITRLVHGDRSTLAYQGLRAKVGNRVQTIEVDLPRDRPEDAHKRFAWLFMGIEFEWFTHANLLVVPKRGRGPKDIDPLSDPIHLDVPTSPNLLSRDEIAGLDQLDTRVSAYRALIYQSAYNPWTDKPAAPSKHGPQQRLFALRPLFTLYVDKLNQNPLTAALVEGCAQDWCARIWSG